MLTSVLGRSLTSCTLSEEEEWEALPGSGNKQPWLTWKWPLGFDYNDPLQKRKTTTTTNQMEVGGFVKIRHTHI